MHALKTCIGSWTLPLAGLKSCISTLSSSANTAEGVHISSLILWDSLEELGNR